MTKKNLHSSLALILAYLTFRYMALERLIDDDEGFYLSATKSWIEGRSLYFDFFFPQMPLMPWIYGIFGKIFGLTWESARLFSAFLGSLVGLAIFTHLTRYGMRMAWIGLLLFCSHSLVFPWFATAKTFQLSVLFLLGGLFLIQKGKSLPHILLAGICFGLSIDTRLFFAGLLPVFIILIIQESQLGERLRNLILFASGAVLALTPVIIIASQNFDVFWFNNFGYHLLRDSTPAELQLEGKLRVAKTILGLRDAAQIEGYQFPLLLILATITQISLWLKNRSASGAYLIALGLFFINFLPTPTYNQYFCAVVPFLVIAAAPTLSKFPAIPMSIFLLGYLFFVREDFVKYTKTGDGVVGMMPGNAPNRRLIVMKEIADSINQQVPKGIPVIADWPGLLIDSHASFYPGLENPFGKVAAKKLSPEQKQRYRVLSAEDIRNELNNPAAQFVLIEDSEYKVFNKDYGAKMPGFRKISKVHSASLYGR